MFLITPPRNLCSKLFCIRLAISKLKLLRKCIMEITSIERRKNLFCLITSHVVIKTEKFKSIIQSIKIYTPPRFLFVNHLCDVLSQSVFLWIHASTFFSYGLSTIYYLIAKCEQANNTGNNNLTWLFRFSNKILGNNKDNTSQSSFQRYNDVNGKRVPTLTIRVVNGIM